MQSRTIAAVTLLVLVGGLAFAQTAPTTAAKAQAPMPCGMQGMKGKQGMMPGPAMPDMTPEQIEKMDVLRTALVKEMLPLRTDLQVKRIELKALWRAGEPDAKKIIAKVKEIGGLRQKLEITRINHRFDMRKLMTPEQRKAMKKMGMGHGMMGRGMGHGMRKMMKGKMGGAGCGMQGGGHCGKQEPMMGHGGQQGCPGCKMH